jgi:hypothetical protein
VLDPDLQGTHLKEWTLRSMVATDFARRGVPWVELMAERRVVPTTLNLGPRERLSAGAALVTAGALVARRPLLAAAAVAGTVALNVDLYGTVGRRLGIRGVATAIPLHLLHQLVAGAAVPAGVVVLHTRRSRSSGPRATAHQPVSLRRTDAPANPAAVAI